MNNPLLTRRNNLNYSLQDERTNASSALKRRTLPSQSRQDEHRAAVVVQEDQLQRFGEACEAMVEARVAQEAETICTQRAAETAESKMAAHRLRSHVVPVVDMRFCISHLNEIRRENRHGSQLPRKRHG
jgi:hypothetical protein